MKNYILYHHQEDAVNAVLKAISSGQKKISVEMAHGTGKTMVFAALMEHLFTNGKMAVIVHTLQEKEHLKNFLTNNLEHQEQKISILESITFLTYSRIHAKKESFTCSDYSFIFLFDFEHLSSCCNLFDSSTTLIGFTSGIKSNKLHFSALDECSTDELFTDDDCVYKFTISDAVEGGILSPTIDPETYGTATLGFCQRLFELFGCKLLNKKAVEYTLSAKVDMLFSLGDQKVRVECKTGQNEQLASQALSLALSRMSPIKTDHENDICILIVLGNITDKEKEVAYNDYGVNLWDTSNLLYYVQHDDQLYEELTKLFYYPLVSIKASPPIGWLPSVSIKKHSHKYIQEKTESLKKRLNECETGHENSIKYEKVCQDIIEFLFSDVFYTISPQYKTDDEHFRMDLICSLRGENEGMHNFWKLLSKHYNSHFIVFEFKNYKDPIEQNLIYITEKYLFNASLRNVAIIISHYGFSDSAQFAAQGCLKENAKLILDLTNADLITMLEMKATAENPANILLNKFEKFLMSISK